MRPNARYWLILAAILLVGGFARFFRLDLIHWCGDQAEALSRAIDFTQSGRFPMRGLNASTGRANPPGFIWLVAIPAAIRPEPVFTTGFIALLSWISIYFTARAGRLLGGRKAGLMAAALLALSPWALVHSRSLWSINVYPFFCSLEMWLMIRWLRRPRALDLASLLVVGAFLPQIHFSGAAILPVVALAVGFGWRRWLTSPARKAAAIVVAAGLVVSMWAPYWIVMRRYERDPASRHWDSSMVWLSHGPAMPPITPLEPRALPRVYPTVLASTLQLHSAEFMEWWVGLAGDSDTMHIYRHIWKAWGLLASACLIVAAVAASGLWRRPGSRYSWRQRSAQLLLLWLFMPALGLCTRLQYNYPQYFIVCLPAGFLLMARHAETLARARGLHPFVRQCRLLLILCLGFALAYTLSIGQEMLYRRGFPEGNYGIGFSAIPGR